MAVPSTSVAKHCHVPCPSHLGPRRCALHIWHRAPPCPVSSTSISRHRHTPCPSTPGTQPCHGPCPPHLALSPALGVTPWAQPAQVLSEHAHQICLYPPLPPRLSLAWLTNQRGLQVINTLGNLGLTEMGREGRGKAGAPSYPRISGGEPSFPHITHNSTDCTPTEHPGLGMLLPLHPAGIIPCSMISLHWHNARDEGAA